MILYYTYVQFLSRRDAEIAEIFVKKTSDFSSASSAPLRDLFLISPPCLRASVRENMTLGKE